MVIDGSTLVSVGDLEQDNGVHFHLDIDGHNGGGEGASGDPVELKALQAGAATWTGKEVGLGL